MNWRARAEVKRPGTNRFGVAPLGWGRNATLKGTVFLRQLNQSAKHKAE
jgi:hypothetical protein